MNSRKIGLSDLVCSESGHGALKKKKKKQKKKKKKKKKKQKKKKKKKKSKIKQFADNTKTYFYFVPLADFCVGILF